MSEIQPSATANLLSVLLNSDLLRWLVTELVQVWREHRFNGTYRVEMHHATLELMDAHGSTAVYTKRQLVTFLQNDVFAIQDQAWGDGDIFENYICSPGYIVDKYQEGYRWKVLVSLHRTYKRGDKEDILIQRTIENGFTSNNETFQIQVDHPMQELTLSLIFPSSRLPQKVSIVENNLKRAYLLGQEHRTQFPDGRLSYTWKVSKPRLFEGYIMKWNW